MRSYPYGRGKRAKKKVKSRKRKTSKHGDRRNKVTWTARKQVCTELFICVGFIVRDSTAVMFMLIMNMYVRCTYIFFFSFSEVLDAVRCIFLTVVSSFPVLILFLIFLPHVLR